MSPFLAAIGDNTPNKCGELVTSFHDSKCYKVHGRVLQFYLRHGLVLDKVHSIVSFVQGPFMRPYVEKTNAARKASRSNVENMMHKLLANSVFGKMLENKANRRNLKIVTTQHEFAKHVSHPLCELVTPLGEHTALIENASQTVKMDSPIQVGAAILDLAKLALFSFVYDKLKVWDSRARVVYTDTDSIIFTSPLPLTDFFTCHPEAFDRSNYSMASGLQCNVNKGKFGVMKNELAKRAEFEYADEFIG